MLTKHKAIDLLQRQLDLIDEVRARPRFSSEFKKWQRDTRVAIENIFEQDASHVKDFTEIRYFLSSHSPRTKEEERDGAFQRGLDLAASVLVSMMDEVREYWDDASVVPTRDRIRAIENICVRFHLVAKQLLSRYDGRETLRVEDEYDVQNLFHALLALEFEDIRPEEWTPSYAGSRSRMDFLLKQEGIVVEVKKTRRGFEAKRVGGQLIIDIQRYQSHPDCQTLICFVYDPEGQIANPRGLENDLSGEHNGLEVRVIVAPKGL